VSDEDRIRELEGQVAKLQERLDKIADITRDGLGAVVLVSVA
jgi:hypothetical protein